MFSRIRLTVIISIALIGLAISPLVLHTTRSTEITREALEESNGQRFQELALSAINEIDQTLYARRQDIDKLAKIVESESIDLENNQSLSKTLEKWKSKYGIYSAILFVKNNGEIAAASDRQLIGRSVRNEVWYKSSSQSSVYSQALASSGATISAAKIGELQYDSLTGGYGINITTPIYSADSNKKEGLLVSRLNWSEIANIINRVNVTPEGQSIDSYTLLLDKKGNAIAGPGFLLTEKQDNDEIIFSKNLVKQNWSAAKEALSGNTGYALQSQIENQEYLVGYAASKGYLDFTGLGWATLVVENTAKTFSPTSEIKTLFYTVLILALIVSLVVSLLFSRTINQQIKSIQSTLEALGKGYFKERTTLTNNTELGTLGSALNQAAQNIESLVEQERSLKETAEHSNRAKGEFLAEIGSEFRTPLGSIIEISEALLETNLSDDQRALARSMRKSSCQLLALANDIREISRMETGQDNLEAKSFDFRNLIEEVAELLATTSQHLGIDIVVYYNSTTPSQVMGDAVRVHQVFTNLLTHALKSTQSKQVLVSVHSKEVNNEESMIHIIVEDSGLTLDSERLAYLFDATENDKINSTEETHNATGDLATSKRIIELMGGKLASIVTEQGTALLLSLPVKKDRNAETEAEINLNSQTAVVATGNQIIDSVISKYLSEKGAHCVTSAPTNLEETLANINNGVVQLVTTNSLLSEKPFLDVAQSYSSKHKMPIVSLSTFSEQLSQSTKKAFPGVQEIAKPVRKNELLRSMIAKS